MLYGFRLLGLGSEGHAFKSRRAGHSVKGLRQHPFVLWVCAPGIFLVASWRLAGPTAWAGVP